jgi:hypothetical protein
MAAQCREQARRNPSLASDRIASCVLSDMYLSFARTRTKLLTQLLEKEIGRNVSCNAQRAQRDRAFFAVRTLSDDGDGDSLATGTVGEAGVAEGPADLQRTLGSGRIAPGISNDSDAESTMNSTILPKRILFNATLAVFLTMLLTPGCSTTVESKPEAAKALESGGPLPPAVTSFFGDDASKLQPGPQGGMALTYNNPNAKWSKYNKIQLMPVEFWAAADTKVSQSDQQMLTTYMYNKLQEDLSKSFALVNQPGPDVLTLRVALMDATTAVPGLRTVSVVVPQARILNGLQSLATGSYAFVGSAEAEGKITDSTTGELLAGAVDQRAGGLGLKSAASFQWGDAENVMDYWAQRVTTRILELQGKTTAQS